MLVTFAGAYVQLCTQVSIIRLMRDLYYFIVLSTYMDQPKVRSELKLYSTGYCIRSVKFHWLNIFSKPSLKEDITLQLLNRCTLSKHKFRGQRKFVLKLGYKYCPQLPCSEQKQKEQSLANSGEPAHIVLVLIFYFWNKVVWGILFELGFSSGTRIQKGTLELVIIRRIRTK